MVIGKTIPCITKAEIFSKFSEVEILTTVFPQVTSLPFKMSSPLRRDVHPSFGLSVSKEGHVYFKDYATQERGGLLDLLCLYWNCTFLQVLTKLSELLVEKKAIDIKPRQIKTLTRKETDQLSKLQVTVRPWQDDDIAYWESFGITKKWLKYAEVYPISHKIITKKETPESKSKKYIFTADKYAYCFVERKEGHLQLKIYQPFNTKGFKWCSKMDGSVVGLWTKIPEFGDRVVICSSLKDALCLSCQLHIPTLCLQGEGYGMSETAVNELKRRYKKVFVSFDTDKAGIENGKKLSKQTDFVHIIPDLGNQKDYSDYYKSLQDKSQFLELEKLFH